MKKDSVIDYLSYILFRALGFFIRKLPYGLIFFLGRRLGDALYYFDTKHKAIAYSNIKTALGDKIPPPKLSCLTKDFYRSFGQTIIEMFLFLLVDKKYIEKYITLEGLDNIATGFKKGKGVILTVVHEGSWEISNIISANLGYPFNIIVRDQPRFQRLNNLLSLYRTQKGSKLIHRQNQTKDIIRVLKNNEAIAMTVDQGGSLGSLVKFFGKDASMSTGAIKLALKFGATIIPVFSTRLGGPYIKFFIDLPFEIKETGDSEKDVIDNLQRLVSLYEKRLAVYPKEYLWTYKIWKYGKEKNILILSDSKAGHLRQAEGLAEIICSHLKEKNEKAHVQTIKVKFKNKSSRIALALGSCFSGKYYCQGCLWCLRNFLVQETYNSIISIKPDIVISCGSSIAPVNFIVSRENLAKSFIIMRPSLLSTKRFDLVVMNRHDRPPRRKNIVVTDGALNLVNEEYLKSEGQRLKIRNNLTKDFVLGLLIGGDTKNFKLEVDTVKRLIAQVKDSLEKFDGELLVTTSRRTSYEVERLVKEEFKDYSRCKLLIIANENNIPEAVGGILALSGIIVTSAESISMISEAVNSKKYVLVFHSRGLSRKHGYFLKYFAKNKYVYLSEVGDIFKTISNIWLSKPEVRVLRDNLLVSEAIKKIL